MTSDATTGTDVTALIDPRTGEPRGTAVCSRLPEVRAAATGAVPAVRVRSRPPARSTTRPLSSVPSSTVPSAAERAAATPP